MGKMPMPPPGQAVATPFTKTSKVDGFEIGLTAPYDIREKDSQISDITKESSTSI